MKQIIVRRPHWLISMAAAALAACGGGGADDAGTNIQAPAPVFGTATPVSSPPMGSLPPEPDGAATGLSQPTLQLHVDAHDAVLLAKRMADAGNRAAGALAVLALGPLDAGVRGLASPSACPTAGTLAYVPNGLDTQTYMYSGCQSGSLTFNGTASVHSQREGGVLKGFTVTFTDLQVSGPDAPPSITGSLACTPAADPAAAPACVATYAGFEWGRNTLRGTNGLEGTHQCTCDTGTWNVTFDDFTAVSGLGYAVATNGRAVVTRTSEKDFRTVLMVGSDSQAFDVVLK